MEAKLSEQKNAEAKWSEKKNTEAKWRERKIMKWKEKYRSETKPKEKFVKRKEAKTFTVCEIFPKTCKMEAKPIPFRFVLLWSIKNLKQNRRTIIKPKENIWLKKGVGEYGDENVT